MHNYVVCNVVVNFEMDRKKIKAFETSWKMLKITGTDKIRNEWNRTDTGKN